MNNNYYFWGMLRETGEKFDGFLKSKSTRQGKVLQQLEKLLLVEKGIGFEDLSDFGYKKF